MLFGTLRCVVFVSELFKKMAKRGRRAFTLHEKLAIISDIEKGTSQAIVCLKMGLRKSTVSTIWTNREKIQNDWKVNYQKKKMRLPSHPKVDEMLFKWFQQNRANNFPVSGPILQIMAEEFGKLIGEDFKCSSGWLDRFKKRHNIVFGKICGKSASVDRNVADDWLVHVWPLISNDYTEDNIFNADETGIFYKMLPDQTHKLKGETCSGGKMSKERITAMVCANASGTEKRKLLIIGKYQNPRCFKNVKTLPVDYSWNDKAWMTSAIFVDYLEKWDRELIRKNRKILLLVDNCPAHPEVKLHNIQLHFFPPNVTSVLQRMDQGVIWSLKQIYRKQMLIKIMATPGNINKSFSILDAVNLLSLSWDDVSIHTIRNCFRHAGMLKTVANAAIMESDPEDDLRLAELIRINKLMFLSDFEEFVNVDNNLAVREDLPDTDLVNQILQEEEVDDMDQDDDVKEEPAVTTEEALGCVQTLQHYFLQQENSIEMFSKLNKVKLILQNNYIKKHCSE